MVSHWLRSWLPAVLLATQLNASPLQPRASVVPIPSEVPSPLQPRAGVVPSVTGPLYEIGTGTYPRANFLADGSLIGAYTAFTDSNSVITIARSPDNGATWTQIGTVASGPTATTDVDNPYPFQLPSGRILVAFRNHNRTAPTTWTYYRITICYSDDDGATWDYLSTADEHADSNSNGIWEPLLRTAADGTTLQLYYSRENNITDQDSILRTSTDGGVTWSDAATISGAALPDSRDGMLGVAEVDGPQNLIAVFETEKNGSLFHIEAVTSSDGGATWSEDRIIVYQPTVEGATAAAPQVVNVGGTLVASFQTDEDAVGSVAAKVVTSGDGGQTWGNKITFLEAVSQWAGLVSLNETHLLGLAGHGGAAKAQTIVLA